MAKIREMNMTEGPLTKQLVSFAVPLILTGIIQLLFNTADQIVVGKFASDQSLAAVGSTGSLTNLLVNLFIGISSGAGAVAARHFAAHNDEYVSNLVHTAVLVSLISGFSLALVGWFFSKPLLEMMGSPEDTIDLATLYMRIYFLGMPANMLYNFGASILRAVGDTKRPLYFITASGAVNVALNLILVIVFRLDVAGVAIATVVSQVISATLVTMSLIKADGCYHLDLKRLRIHKKELTDSLKLGVPAGIQSSLFAISNVIIQSSVNYFGSIVMAGNAAAASIEGFIYVAMNSFYHTCLNFTSQNYGAGNRKRMHQVIIRCAILGCAVGLAMGLFSVLFDVPLLSVFTKTGDPIPYGIVRITVFGLTYWLCGLQEVITGFLRGLGRSVVPMINSITFVCVMRIVWVRLVFDPMKLTDTPENALRMLYFSYAISWILVAAANLIYYRFFVSKKISAQLEGK